MEYTYMDPAEKGIEEGSGKDGKTNSLLCFGQGNIVPELCEEDEKTLCFFPEIENTT
jgi:hypothetical protein